MEEKALEEVGRGTHCSMLASFTQHDMYQLTFSYLEYCLPPGQVALHRFIDVM